jgi:hypothetical protein
MEPRENTRIIRNDTLAGEPRLRDVFEDPIVHAVMARDGVSIAELQGVVRTWRRRQLARAA